MTQQEIKRRTLAKGAAWAAPAILASSQIPAYAASSSTSPDSCEYGKIVSAPWFSPWPVNYNGSAAKEIDWAVYPTSKCSSGAQALSISNSFPKSQAGAPTGNPSSTYWPPTYPAGGSTIPDYNSVSGVNGVGAGEKIYVTIENVAGDVNYIETPTGDQRFIFSGGAGAYSSNGTRGAGANVPMIRLNDDFKGYKNPTTFSYLRFSQAPIVEKTSIHTWGYGDHYTTAEGRDGWRWEIESMSNITNGNAGAAVVSFMTRLPAAQYGDASRSNSKTIPVQYRVTVTSPWGVVTYLSDAV